MSKLFTCGLLLFSLFLLALALSPIRPSQAENLPPPRTPTATPSATTTAPPATSATIGEGRDFASLVLHDPWDMNEYSDVSMYINRSGQLNSLQNMTIQNGVFSASGTDSDPWFHVLFPGYETAMLIDKVGAQYPISTANYDCLYVAANISHATIGQIYWFPDETLANFGWVNFTTYANSWRLYPIDLNAGSGGSPWGSRALWQGLRVDPSLNAGVNFAVDWVRLTPCTPAPLALTGLGASQNYEFYITTASGDIYVAPFATNNAGSASVDLQGVPPGTYTWKAKQGNTVAFSGSVTINPTPVASFTRPSFTSGVDYASQAGNAWDFSDASDTPLLINFASATFANGTLDMSTNSGTIVADPDPQVVLNSPQAVTESLTPYRYLSVRMYTAGAAQNVPYGMIARWVWQRNSSSNNACYLVTHDIPFDIGWQTITIDLYHAFNGTPEQMGGDCGGVSTVWQTNTQAIQRFRFDPNENILGYPMVQKLDWIRLTKVDEVKQGQPFPIQITLNMAAGLVPVKQYYYTTNPTGAPTQNVAQAYNPTPVNGAHKNFLPLVRSSATASGTQATFMWNTAGVAPNTYYICAHVEDTAATNAAASTYCSPAPVNVVP